MIYEYKQAMSAKALPDLRESIGWNRMESEYNSPLMTSYYHIAVCDKDKLVGYLKEKHIYMISVVFEERLKAFYKKFGFYNMLCGQIETYSSN